MKPETIFPVVNATAILGWLLLAVAPRWRVTKAAVQVAIPILLSAAYLVLIVLFFGSAQGGFSSLAGVMELFTEPWVAMAGWIHYLAFDLFVGAWEVRDSERHGVSHWLVVPCLFFTFMFGPAGLLMYVATRMLFGRGGAK